jgi:trigger factor
MNIVCENLDALNGVLKVQVGADDYKSKYDKTLVDYRKKANIPGFRPGKAPMGFIVKQYGKAVLADELNRLVNDGLYKYISENNLQILGAPIPKSDEEVVGNWDNPSDFEFVYEIGYAPSFDIPLSEKDTFDYYQIAIDKKLLDEEVDNIRRRYGKMVSTDTIEGNEIISCHITELDAEGNVKDAGIDKNTSFSMELLSDKKVIKALKDAKIGDVLELEVAKLTKDNKDLAAMLGVSEAELGGIGQVFKVEINDVRMIDLAELNQELFDKIYGPGVVASEDELRTKIQVDLEAIFNKNAQVVFMNKIYDHLMEKVNPEFPVDFLKRWLKLSSDKPLTDEQWDNEMGNYLRSLKYRLIQNKVFEGNNVEISYTDIMEHAKNLLLDNYRQYGIPTEDIPEQEIMQSVTRILQDEEQRNEIQSQVTERKFEALVSGMVKKKERKVSYEEFVALSKNA